MFAATVFAAASIAMPAALPVDHTPTRLPHHPSRSVAVLKRGFVPERALRQDGREVSLLPHYLKLDDGHVTLCVNVVTEDCYIDAKWPYSGEAMQFALERARFHGFQPIPEWDSPAEARDDGVVRIYLEPV